MMIHFPFNKPYMTGQATRLSRTDVLLGMFGKRRIDNGFARQTFTGLSGAVSPPPHRAAYGAVQLARRIESSSMPTTVSMSPLLRPTQSGRRIRRSDC
jgi:hypothetical protein